MMYGIFMRMVLPIIFKVNMAKNKKITLTEIANSSWKEYALYTLEERALPSMIDGLKPSQRFIIYSALKNAKDKLAKVVEIAGTVASYGYHHGETSAQDAAVSMACDWANNIPLLQGKGYFGNRLVNKAASPRYIYAKMHQNFHNIFLDTNLAPRNPDDEVQTPLFYLPIIPFVLMNGIRGTATGYGTNILPYDINDIIKLSKERIKGKDILKKTILPKFPQFNGKVELNVKGGYDLVGTFERPAQTKLIITEIPYQYDREEYIKVLDDLEEKEIILSYSDECRDNFRFSIKLKRDFDGDIEKVFKLRRSMTENLNVIGYNGKLREFQSPVELIQEFCDIRLPYVQARIDTTISSLNEDMALIIAKIKFIKNVLDNKIIFKGKTKRQLSDHLTELKFKDVHIDALLGMHFYHLTQEEIDKLGMKYNELEDKLKYFQSTTAETEYLLDLDKLTKEYR